MVVKPRVKVLRAQGKPLLVFVWGNRFIAAFTWPVLERKHELGLYQPLTATLIERLALTKKPG